jgi:hypothetical protein
MNIQDGEPDTSYTLGNLGHDDNAGYVTAQGTARNVDVVFRMRALGGALGGEGGVDTPRYVITYFSLYSVYIQSIFSVKVSLN